MTLLTAGALIDPHLPATASNVCATDAWLGGVGRVLNCAGVILVWLTYQTPAVGGLIVCE